MDCVDEMRITVIATGIQDGNVPVEKGGKVGVFSSGSGPARQAVESETSFGRTRIRKVNVNESTDLNVPTYVRLAKNQPAAEERRHEVRRCVNGGEDAEFLFEEEEFEIPSFIRLQAD